MTGKQVENRPTHGTVIANVSDPSPIHATVSLGLFPGPPHRCHYLPDRTARLEYAVPARLDAHQWQVLMDAGFRRSGQTVYRTACHDCRECVPIRVPVDAFVPSRSQRRVLRRNADLSIEIGPPRPDDEKYRIFAAYQTGHHGSPAADSRDDFEAFLYRSPVESLEVLYRLGPAAVGTGIVDVASASLSSVYFYFDPPHARRSLGTFSALTEIDLCRRMGKPYWYAGYYIRECNRMNYKAAFRPHELLAADGRWQKAT